MISKALPHSYTNRDEIKRSETCACFHCFKFFPPSEIRLWTDSIDPNDDDSGAVRDDNSLYLGMTAICPYCEYDSVIGSASGNELTEEFLKELSEYWYQGRH